MIAGSFGEWRPSNDGNTAGRPHYGLDLTAVAGTPVYPVARGVISEMDQDQIVVIHGNGAASRYVHVDAQCSVGRIVEKSTVIALTNQSDAHLHLEITPSGVPNDYWSALNKTFGFGTGAHRIDPASISASFAPPLVSPDNYVGNQRIGAIYLWNQVPNTSIFGDVDGARCDANATCFVAEVVNSINGHTLIPATIAFSTEDPVSQRLNQQSTFTFGSENEMLRLFQSTRDAFANFGYVRRVGNAMPKKNQYQMWFAWDTSGYASRPVGPRKVQLNLTGLFGDANSTTFTFGPWLDAPDIAGVPIQRGSNSFFVTAYSFMGPFPVSQTGSPQDTLTFTVVGGGTASWNAYFIDPNSGRSAPTLQETFYPDSSGSAHDKVTLFLQLKPGANPAPVETLTVVASSGVFPNIAHQRDVQNSPIFNN